MSNTLKKVWITEVDGTDLINLHFESESTDELSPYHLRFSELTFPKVPTIEHPLRHTCNLGFLTDDDLFLIRKKIDEYLGIL